MKRFHKWAQKNIRGILVGLLVLILAADIYVFAMPKPDDTEGVEVADSTYSTVSLKWEKSDDAVAYRIYRSTNGGEYEYLATTADTDYVDSDIRTGTEYSYAVTARNGIKSSDLEDAEKIEAVPSLEQPQLEVDTTEGEMKLSYSEVDGAIGYEIIRDGEVIAQSEDTVYVDEEVDETGGSYNYEVKAYRYKKEPVYSESSNNVEAELHTLTDMTIETSDQDLIIRWTGNNYYHDYKLYNGDELLTETTGSVYRLSSFEVGKEYDLKLIGYTEDDSTQSPETVRNIMVREEEMTNQDAIDAAVEWGITIAADDSFTYGTGKRSHRYGCYFCQTNVGPRLNLKGKSKVNGHSYAKTYCCNPFVHACYAHGAGDPAMLKACQSGHGIAMTKKSFTRYGCWKCVGKLSKSKLKKGDVLVRSNHVMMYIGDGKVVHAAGGGWDANSIRVAKNSGNYSFVMRYTGTGRGVKYVVRDVDENGNVLDEDGNIIETPAAENEEAAGEAEAAPAEAAEGAAAETQAAEAQTETTSAAATQSAE